MRIVILGNSEHFSVNYYFMLIIRPQEIGIIIGPLIVADRETPQNSAVAPFKHQEQVVPPPNTALRIIMATSGMYNFQSIQTQLMPRQYGKTKLSCHLFA